MSFVLEENQRFSRSILWDLQRQYFDEMGADAWKQGEVPHYVTTNPRMANSYAAVIFALYADVKAAGGMVENEPFYMLELGAGSGRFAYLLLQRLHWLCDQVNLPRSSFVYIISDFTQKNVDYWRAHASFQPYFEEGLADIALFDATQQADLVLQVSGKIIQPGSLQHPLSVVANYFFDSIPQELFYCSKQVVRPCLVSLIVQDDPEKQTTAEILKQARLSYQLGNGSLDHYQQNHLQEVLDFYRQCFDDAYVFIPESGIECVRHLGAFSANGILLLTADKGDHVLERVRIETAPEIVTHGSFSINVNYHALRMYCESVGGKSLFPKHLHSSINIGCFLLMPDGFDYTSVAFAFRQFIQESGPDDYYTNFRSLQENMAGLYCKNILAALRISLFDCYQLQHFLPRLREIAADISIDEKNDLVTAIHACWANYFSLDEKPDLAREIAVLLYQLDIYDSALHFFQLFVERYGDADSDTQQKMIVCIEQCNDATE